MIARVARALLPFALTLACSDSTTPLPTPSLIGPWDWTSVRTASSPNGQVCQDTGSFLFTKDGASYRGTLLSVVSCSGTGGSYSYPARDSLSSITLSGSRLTFVRGPYFNACSDTATLTSGAQDELTGVSRCGFSTERWHAMRGRPIASVAVWPASVTTVGGVSPHLTAVLRTASGARAFGRAVAWSSDAPSVINVDSSGVVTPSSVGSGNVTATAEAHSASSRVSVVGPTRLSNVGAGDARTCALGADGFAYCWGHEAELYAIFPGRINVPVPLPGGMHFAALSNGYRFGCGLTADGSAYCWGSNAPVHLGNDNQPGASIPVPVAGGLHFTALTAGGDHACGLAASGVAWCWGANASGQLGNASTATSSVPVAVAGSTSFVALSAGAEHSCGIAVNGALFCWGQNNSGQLGDGTTTSRAVPNAVAGGLTWSRVSAGASHSCAIATGGAAYCWGADGVGQLGSASTTDQVTPTPVSGGHLFASIAAGSIHSCGVDTAGAGWCWGANYWGQLGNGTVSPNSPPVAVTGGLGLASITTGLYSYSDESHNWTTSAHSCAVSTGGVSYCWGDNLIGQLGIGTAVESSNVPVRVAGQP